MLIYDHWFHAAFIRLSSDRKVKILEKSKKSKRMFKLELRISLCVRVYVLLSGVCVCVCY